MYSRRFKIEETRNKRKALIFFILSIVSIYLIITYGIPAIAKFASFLTELRKSSEPVEITDTTPPPPPHLESIPLATNNIKIDIQGSTEAGAEVTIFVNDSSQQIMADSDGKFITTIKLSEGENTIYAMAKDKSGNESQKTELQKIVYDKEPPILDIVKPQNKSEFYGSKQRQIVIEGKTEEDSKIQINDRQIVVESDGSFSFATTLKEGTNDFNIKAEDLSGNKTEKSISVTFYP